MSRVNRIKPRAKTGSQAGASPKEFDPDALEVKSGVPLPGRAGVRAQKYQRLLEKLEVGQSVEFPAKWTSRMSSAALGYVKRTGSPKRFAVRKISETVSGLWRVE